MKVRVWLNPEVIDWYENEIEYYVENEEEDDETYAALEEEYNYLLSLEKDVREVTSLEAFGELLNTIHFDGITSHVAYTENLFQIFVDLL